MSDETRVPALPRATDATFLAALKEIIEVREGRRGNVLDRFVTLRELVSGGVVTVSTGSSGRSVIGTQTPPATDLTPPPSLTGFTATGAYSSIILSWDPPAYRNHAYVEVWRSNTDAIGAAVLIGQSPTQFYTDALGTNKSAYYWVRSVSTADVVGPFNAVSGTLASTSPDVAYLLTQLTGQITTGQLYSTLQDTIALSANQYTIKIDGAGRAAGFGLSSTVNTAGVGTSQFGVVADQFFIAPPVDYSQEATPSLAGSTGKVWFKPSTKVTYISDGAAWNVYTPVMPFIVQATATTINGMAVPAGVYMNGAYIENGSITNAKIGTAAIDNAKIVSLDVSKLANIASAAIGADIWSTNWSSGTTGWKIQANGTAEFNSNVTVKGAIYASSGTIGGATIASTYVQSTNYTSTTGWKLDNTAGSITLNSASIGGNTVTSTAVSSPGFTAGTSGWTLKSDGTAEFGAASIRGTLDATQVVVGLRGLTSSVEFLAVPIARVMTGTVTDISVPVTVAVPLWDNHVYTATAYWQDGYRETRTVTNAAGTTPSTLTFAATDAGRFTKAPEANSLLVLQVANQITIPTGTVQAGTTATSVVLGASVALASGVTYKLTMSALGTTLVRTVTSAGGAVYTTLNIESTGTPVVTGASWTLEIQSIKRTTVAWNKGHVIYTGASNGPVDITVNAGYDASYTSSTIYVYLPSSASGTVSASTTTTYATAAGGIMLAAYYGTNDIALQANNTLIDGSQIKTGTITAEVGAIGALAVDTLQIANQAVTVPVIVASTYTPVNDPYAAPSPWDTSGSAPGF